MKFDLVALPALAALFVCISQIPFTGAVLCCRDCGLKEKRVELVAERDKDMPARACCCVGNGPSGTNCTHCF